MSKKKARKQRAAQNTGQNSTALLLSGWEDLGTRGYTALINSPDVALAVGLIADIISSAPLHLYRNTETGDVRVKNSLSRFIDITPYSLGTRKTLISWIVTYMLTTGDGNAFVLPVTEGGYLSDLIPMPGAYAVGVDNDSSYLVHWHGRQFHPDEVLHFALAPDLERPWMGRGFRVQLRDVLRNLKQANATTNSFMTSQGKPSLVVKVDGISDEFASPKGRQDLLDTYINGQQAGQPWIIPADLVDVVTVKPLSLADLAISDTVALDKRTVAATIGVPPFALGLGTYSQDEYNNFVRRKIITIADGIAQVFTRGLILSPDMFLRFSTRRLYAYGIEQLAKVGDDQYVRGIMTGNEVRDWLGLSPKDGLDELVMLENYIPAGMIGEQKKLIQEGKANE